MQCTPDIQKTTKTEIVVALGAEKSAPILPILGLIRWLICGLDVLRHLLQC